MTDKYEAVPKTEYTFEVWFRNPHLDQDWLYQETVGIDDADNIKEAMAKAEVFIQDSYKLPKF